MEFSLVCTGTSEEVEQVFVCGEDQAFFECDCELPRALVDLIAAYYVFDVKYPQCFSGVLYFLQEVVLLQVDSDLKEPSMPPLWRSLRRRAKESNVRH